MSRVPPLHRMNKRVTWHFQQLGRICKAQIFAAIEPWSLTFTWRLAQQGKEISGRMSFNSVFWLVYLPQEIEKSEQKEEKKKKKKKKEE